MTKIDELAMRELVFLLPVICRIGLVGRTDCCERFRDAIFKLAYQSVTIQRIRLNLDLTATCMDSTRTIGFKIKRAVL